MSDTYTTAQGETWDTIAVAVWGSEHLCTTLLQANPEYRNVLYFSAGTVLEIPDVDTSTVSDTAPPWAD
jgi:phage tail protein X